MNPISGQNRIDLRRDPRLQLGHAVVHRQGAGAADGEDDQQHEHQGGELQRLPAVHEALPAMDQDGAGQDGDLHPSGDAGQQADGEHQAAHEMGEGDVVEQGRPHEPRELQARHQLAHELGPGVGDDDDAADEKAQAEIDADAIEPDLGMGFRPVDELTQLFHGNSLRGRGGPAGGMSAGWLQDMRRIDQVDAET